MNDNVYQMKLTTEYEERIYVIQADGTSFYQILFLKGNRDAKLNQIRQFKLASPYLTTLLNTYVFNNHEVFKSVTDLRELIHEALFLYSKDGEWFELNTATLERLNTIFKAMVIESTTIDEQMEGSKALRYFADELLNQAAALKAWHKEKMLNQDVTDG